MKFATVVLAMVLSGCAGSPINVANNPNSREMRIGSESAYVVNENGMWLATYKDYFAKQMYNSPAETLSRKLGLIAAIEGASGCKVTESTQDPMGLTVQAVVACAQRSASPPPIQPAQAQPSQVAQPLRRAVGEDTLNAERIAREQRCAAEPRASLIAKGPGYESYSVACANGDTMMVRCEFGNCRLLR